MRALLSLSLSLVALGCGIPDPGAEDELPAPTPARDRLVLAIHGSQDDPDVWANDALERLGPHLPEPERWAQHAWDWSARAEARGLAASRGQDEGEALADDLLALAPGYAHVLVVAHSVGAFVAQSMIEALARDPRRGPHIHVVFLDPFGMDGILDWDHGQTHFGRTAPAAEAYLNTDDASPTTDDPLEHAHNVDVTPARPTDWPDDRAHWWPIEAWLRLIEAGPDREGIGADAIRRALRRRQIHRTRPRGATLTLERLPSNP